MPFSNENKSASPTWQRFVRRGKSQTMGELGEFDFTETVEEGGGPIVGDTAISKFSEDSQTWSAENKSASPSWSNENKS